MYPQRTKLILIGLVAAAIGGWSSANATPFREVGGIVVVEAEHFESRRGSDDEHAWKIAPDELSGDEASLAAAGYQNARGRKYMVVLPDAVQNRNTVDARAAGPYM